ncbi:hypothetical protein FRX31_021961 [Thalictrum thalictroides]|uniref:DUF1308 domain-containing protein n=1 Tax=Thalictrum thalictroides TaxID=46969 RepID=A0A7J6VTQ1_THATH|nr:hypothetical protein FRX31_021961 [Thalictrum thalictroides]
MEEDDERGCDGFRSNKWVWEEARKRCIRASEQIESLPLSKLTDSCKRTLFRLVNSELNFILTHLSSSLLPQPLALISVTSSVLSTFFITLLSLTFLVNPNYISWSSSHNNNKGLKLRVEKVLAAAKSSLMLKPASIILFFANGVDALVSHNLKHQFGALSLTHFLHFELELEEFVEDGWINVIAGRSYLNAQTFQIMIDSVSVHKILSLPESNVEDARLQLFNEETRFILGHKFCSLLSTMNLQPKSAAQSNNVLAGDLLNFDTTALIALVSGISNGGTQKLLATPETELRKRFKSNYQFVIAQAMSELQKPILEELTSVMSSKIGLICESVDLEFKQLVSMCGGPNEKLRADLLLKCVLIVPDGPSARMMDILTTRKIALKNKVVFGTGDRWLAPTLTANMGFVRAISQTGMSLLTLEHRPRALTGD